MAEQMTQVTLPRGVVTKAEFLQAVSEGLYNAMRERDRVPAVAALLPCFDCRHGARALEEIAAAYAAHQRGERPVKDDRRLEYLPRTCCRQGKPAAAPMVATATPLGLAATGTGSAADDPRPPQCGT
jgi:hypothetical protein